MMETARSDLFQRFERMKADEGLLDMKFFLGSVSEETVEAVCAEVNRLHTLVEKGDVKEVDAWGDSNEYPITLDEAIDAVQQEFDSYVKCIEETPVADRPLGDIHALALQEAINRLKRLQFAAS